MAEPIKNRKVSLREIMEEIEADENFSPEEVESAREKVKFLQDHYEPRRTDGQ